MAKQKKRATGATPGDLLKILRTEAGLTQAEMAERLRKSQVGYGHYETGGAEIPFERAGDFAQALGMLDENGQADPGMFLQAVGIIKEWPGRRSPYERLAEWFNGASLRRRSPFMGEFQQGGVLVG